MNNLLNAGADAVCNASRYERSPDLPYINNLEVTKLNQRDSLCGGDAIHHPFFAIVSCDKSRNLFSLSAEKRELIFKKMNVDFNMSPALFFVFA